MKLYEWLILLIGNLYTGYLAYLAWRQPDRLLAYFSWYGRIYDRWNPEQVRWVRSPTLLMVMRVACIVAFLLVLAASAMVIVRAKQW